MRILVTGVDGFAGAYVAKALAANGHSVAALTRNPTDARQDAVSSWHSADLGDFSSVTKAVGEVQPEAVIHLAAVSFVGHSDVKEMYTSNILGTRNLLQALVDHAVPNNVMVVSSANIYGNRTSGPLHEGLQADPRSDYALSKLACEHLAAMYSDRIPTGVVRPFNYTGVGQSSNFLIPKIVEHARARSAVIELGNLDVARDFSDVRFFAEAVARLIERPDFAGRTVNICSGRAVTLTELLGLVTDLSGHRLTVKTNAKLMRSQEVEQLWGDDTLLQSLIGPIAGPSLEETIKWMLSSV